MARITITFQDSDLNGLWLVRNAGLQWSDKFKRYGGELTLDMLNDLAAHPVTCAVRLDSDRGYAALVR